MRVNPPSPGQPSDDRPREPREPREPRVVYGEPRTRPERPGEFPPPVNRPLTDEGPRRLVVEVGRDHVADLAAGETVIRGTVMVVPPGGRQVAAAGVGRILRLDLHDLTLLLRGEPVHGPETTLDPVG